MALSDSPLSPWQPWAYRDESWLTSSYDLAGYSITAVDGEIGKVDEATYDTGGSYLVVDTGPWIFGRKVILPAGVVSGIDHENRSVVVDRTSDEIRNAPEFDSHMIDDASYRTTLGEYYDQAQPGTRP